MHVSFIQHIILVLLAIGSFTSCVSNSRITYFQQSGNENAIQFGELIAYQQEEYRLQYNDILDVSIKTLESLLKGGFDLSTGENGMRMNMGGAQGDINYLTGYRVGKDGTIDLPVLGKLVVSGLTVTEAKKAVEKELATYVTSDVFVQVRLGGIRFSVLGEVRRPGKFVVLQERLTIFEALASAGDMTTIANRGEVILIRQYPEGSRMYQVNLNDREIIQSPYYFIQPNDLIYAEPMKIREVGAGENAAQTLSLLISSISALALILNLIAR